MPLRFTTVLILVTLPLACVSTSPSTTKAVDESVELIPRKVLFGNPAQSQVRLSPSGSQIAYLAPLNGALNIFLADIDNLDAAHPLTNDAERGIHNFSWAHTGHHLLFVQDRLGDENYRLYVLDVRDGSERALTPARKMQARVSGLSARHPDHVLVSLNDREPRVHDLYRVNIKTGKRDLLLQNPGFVAFVTNQELEPVLAFSPTKEGGFELHKKVDAGWASLVKFSMEDSTGGEFKLGPKGKWVYFSDPRGRDTSALSRMEIATGETELVVADDLADINELLMDPVSGKVQAAASNYLKKRWHILDPSLESDFAKLRSLSPGDFEILSRANGDTKWLLAYDADSHPLRYYLYDRVTKQGRLLFSSRPDLEKFQLSPMQPVVVTARDGLKLIAYLTLPVGEEGVVPKQPLPTVVYPHGGPWARDVWGYSAKDQWLANRGYAVLRLNFRGSTGLGKNFVNAANKEWAGAMHNDVLDAVQWAVDKGIADSKRTMIMGGSYGGYETLVGLAFSPDVFACGVARVAWSDLVDYLNKTASYNQAYMDLIAARVGDPRTKEGREFLRERSPITRAKDISKPLLLAQGAQDPRSKPEEAEKLIAAVSDEAQVTYLLYKDEGHAFLRAESRISFNALTEVFLQKCLGGRAEPVGDDLLGANYEVVHGQEHLPEAQTDAN